MRITVKEKVLQVLSENRGTYFSGEALAAELQVSRAAVWKAVQTLRDEGFQIEGTTNKGYALSSDTDILSKEEVELFLTEEARLFFRCSVKTVTGSTNDDVREIGVSGAQEGYVLAAEAQTKGKGRQGRAFYSPKNTGVYFSILLRPEISAQDAVLITAAAASAAAKAVEKLSGEAVQIKWVNDLFMRGKKVNGILTEGMIDIETGKISQAVLGLGFNLYTPEGGWPEEISGVAGSIFESEKHIAGMRAKLVAFVLNEFLPLYQTLTERNFIEDYRARQMLFGKEVEVMNGEPPYRIAVPVDVDADCHLLVHYVDEPEEKLHALGSGEVRVRAV